MNELESKIQQLEAEHRFVLSRISHEIRNPVTLINSSLHIIEQEHPEVQEFTFWKETKEDLAYLRKLLDELSSYNNSDRLQSCGFWPVINHFWYRLFCLRIFRWLPRIP